MRILLAFGDQRLLREWLQADIWGRLNQLGHSLDGEGLEGPAGGPAWRRWLRRGLLRTLIYVAWARRGSVTARTKLARRRALRLRLERGLGYLLDRFVCDGVRLARWVEARIPVAPAALSLLADLRPNLLVVLTDVYRGQEVEVVKAARALGIPTLGVPASWDTLTSKGSYLVPPDHLAVWGALSHYQAILHHGYLAKDVTQVGSLRIDAVEVCPGLPGLLAPGQPPVVMVVGTSVAYLEHETALVERLAALAPGAGFRVWYRPHPRRLGRLEGDLEGISGRWRARGVYFDAGAGDSYEHPGHIGAILERVRVVVTAFSTVVIEAALRGTPSLLIGFGPGTGGSEGEQAGEQGGAVVDIAGFEHMAEVTRWPGVRLCRSWEELEAYVRVHVGAMGLPVDGLRECAQRVVRTDGHGADRLVELLGRLAGSSTGL